MKADRVEPDPVPGGQRVVSQDVPGLVIGGDEVLECQDRSLQQGVLIGREGERSIQLTDELFKPDEGDRPVPERGLVEQTLQGRFEGQRLTFKPYSPAGGSHLSCYCTFLVRHITRRVLDGPSR